ncbi:MAG: hypothetical protein ACI4KD_04485 [Oscillospiraceae bacterium]
MSEYYEKGSELIGYPIVCTTPNHNDVIRFDRRLSENGAWVLSNEPLDASATELSYTSDSTEKYGKQTISANTLNGNLKAQRYKSVKVTASIGTKYSSSSTWSTYNGESVADVGELGQVTVSFSKTDLKLYIGTIEIDTEGNISINVTYSKYWRDLKVTIEGVW